MFHISEPRHLRVLRASHAVDGTMQAQWQLQPEFMFHVAIEAYTCACSSRPQPTRSTAPMVSFATPAAFRVSIGVVEKEGERDKAPPLDPAGMKPAE